MASRLFNSDIPYVRTFLLALFGCAFFCTASGQVARHKEVRHWAHWSAPSGKSIEGSFSNGGEPVLVTMKSAVAFFASDIYHFESLPGFAGIPNKNIPATRWLDGRASTTVCFSKQVKDPLLMIASLGRSNEGITLQFSAPFKVIYQRDYIKLNSNTSLTGTEGNVLLMFPGAISCITIDSDKQETSTSLTWGIMMTRYPEQPTVK